MSLSSKLIFVSFIFLFSLGLRLYTLNQMGATWDESAQVVDGYNMIELLKQGDFNNPYWYNHQSHPALTKYIYGLTGHLDATSHKNPHPVFKRGEPLFLYDLPSSHLVSALFGAASVIAVVLIGWTYISPYVGISSGIIFSMLPFFIGLSQIASIESMLMFFFTTSVYLFLKFLRKQNILWVIITGISIGLALETKYTNILLLPLLIWIYLIWYVHEGKKRTSVWNKKVFLIFLIGIVVYILLWPQPWLHLDTFFSLNYDLRVATTQMSIPEVFFGRLMFVPKLYYVVMFLITTPLIALVFFFVGLYATSNRFSVHHPVKILPITVALFKKTLVDFFLFTNSIPQYHIIKKNMWVLFVLVVWFAFPFIQSFYNFRQHGVRYIIEIYAPFSLLAAVGFDYIIRKVTIIAWKKCLLFSLFVLYLGIVLYRISPYYLDYFNGVVGGTNTVYEKRLFQLGWWGQGIKEAAYYVDTHAAKGSTVGLAVVPLGVVPPLKNVKTSEYSPSRKYDYVLVNYFNIVREGFDDRQVIKDYYPVYMVTADQAGLVTVYKRK